jgi:predicted RNA-binding Zn-ribbon protein involved in translation (DUF1610 family)
VHYRAVGRVTLFDGTRVTLTGERAMDLREGSATVELIREKAKRRTSSGRFTSPASQIAELRQHILAHAVTKARLRAIRSMGIRSSYTRLELDQPFVVARLMATGETSDPALRKEFALMRMRTALGATMQMWGDGDGLSSPPRLADRPKAPPPVGSVPEEDEEDSSPLACTCCGVVLPNAQFVDGACPECGTLSTAAAGTRPGAAGGVAPSGPAAAATAGTPPSTRSGFTVPGRGPEGGKPIEEASRDSLVSWCNSIRRKLESGRTPAHYVDSDRRLLDAMDAELDRRDEANPYPW